MVVSKGAAYCYYFFYFSSIYFALSCFCAATLLSEKLWIFVSWYPFSQLREAFDVCRTRDKTLHAGMSQQCKYNQFIMDSFPLIGLMFNQNKSTLSFCWDPLLQLLFHLFVFFFPFLFFYCCSSKLACNPALIESHSMWKQRRGWRQMTQSHIWSMLSLTDRHTREAFAGPLHQVDGAAPPTFNL